MTTFVCAIVSLDTDSCGRLRDGLCPIHGNRLIKHHECSQGMDGRQPVTDSFAADGVCLSCHPLPDYIPWARAQQMQREYHRQQQPPLVLPPQIAARKEQPPVLQPSQHEFVDKEQEQDEKLLPVSTKATSSSRFGDDLTAAATAAAAALSSPLADVPNSKWPATTDSATMAVDAAEVVAQVATAAETLSMTDCTPTAGRVRRSCRFAADAPTTVPSNSFSPPSLKMSAITTIDGDNSNGKVEGLTGQGRAACGRNLTSDAHAPGDYIQRERTGPDNKDENPYQGRTVVVIHGQHRGQQGRILCFDDNGTCRLQIENPETAVRAIIDVECDHCRLLDVVNSDLLDKYRKKAGCEIGIDELGEDELIRRALELSKKTWEEECVARGKNSRAVMSVSCFATDGRGVGKEPRNDVQSQKAANKSMKKPTPSTSWGALSSLPPSSSLISAGRRFVRRRGSACRSNSQGRIEILSDHPIKKRHWTKGKVQADDDGDTQSSSSRNETEIERKSSRKRSFSESARKNTDDNNVSAIATDTTRRSRPLRSCISSEDPEKKRRRPGAPQKLRNVKSVTFCTTSIGEQAAKRRTSPRFFKSSKTSSKGISLQNKKDLRQVDDAADIDVSPIEVDSRDNTETDDKDQSSQQDARPEKRPQKKSKLNPAPAPDHPKSNNDAGRGGGDDGNDDDDDDGNDNDNDDGESSSSSDESENELEDELEELGHTLEEIKAMEQNICSAIDSASSGNVNSKKLAVQKRFVKFLRNKAKEKGPALLITRHSGVDSIVAAIRSFPTSLELLIDSFATLSDICYYNKGTYRLDLEIYPDILKIMKRYSKAKASSNAKLHFHAICTMQHLGIKRSLKHKMIADGCVEQVVESMRLYKSNVDVQDAACLCIQDLAREPQSFEDVETVLNSGAVNCILAAMLRYKTNNKLIDGALAALANIHFDERIQDERKRKLLIDHGLLAILCKTIQSDDACIVFHTFNFLNNITTEALQIDEAIIEAGLITKTAEAMHRFRNDGRVLRCACLFLGNIGHGSEGRPDQIARHGGSMAVIDCLMSFPYCSGVVQEALAALRNIGHPEEHKAVDTVSLVVAVMGFHKDDAVIHNHACCILLQVSSFFLHHCIICIWLNVCD